MIDTPPFSRLRSACVYEGIIAKSVVNLKFYNKLSLVRPLASVLSQCVYSFFQNEKIDAIVPVPLHPKRLAERGFNQSVLIAKELTRGLNIPFLKNGVERVRYTVPQVKLSGKERRRNLRRAFKVPASRVDQIADRTILVVDDVVTTGTTIVEIARTLKRAGAGQVFGVTVARAL